MIKLALAGAGYIAAIHAQAVQNLSAAYNAQLWAVVERTPERRAAFAARFGIPNTYARVDELLASEPVDALVVCTPNFLHAPQSLAALRAGVAVMVEKPMAMNAVEAAEMVAAAELSGTALMVAHCWRFDEEVRWLKGQRERLGKIVRTHGNGVHVNWGPSGWFTQPELAGGGALVDMGVHAIDTARFLLGDPGPVSVTARIGTFYQEAAVDDTSLLLIDWENGAVSYIESGWWQPYSDGPEASTQLYGTHGFGQLFPTRLLLTDPLEKSVETVEPGFVHPRTEHAPQKMYDAQMGYFLECVTTGQTPVPGGAEGLVNMQILDAAYASARSGQVIHLK